MYDRFVRKLYLYLLLERIYPAQNNPVRLSCLILSDLMFRYYIARVFGLLKNILDMIRYLSDIKKPIWISHVLVPERSDKDEYLTRLADFIHSLNNV